MYGYSRMLVIKQVKGLGLQSIPLICSNLILPRSLISSAFMAGNPNPKNQIQPIGEKALVRKMVGCRLPAELDDYVRSLPNQAEWLRKAIARQMEEDLKNAG